MKIKIPGHGPVTVYSDTNIYIEVPGDGPVEIVEATAAGGLPDTVWVSSAGGDAWVSSAGGDYWVSTV
jgi:hypothetical protein